MPGYGTTSTASWPCGGWEWRIGRMRTGMRIKPKPTSSSRCVKAQHKPLGWFHCLGFLTVVLLESAFALLLCLRSDRVLPAWSTSCSKDSNIHAVCGVQYPWQPSGKEDLRNWMAERLTSELNYKRNKNLYKSNFRLLSDC